MKRTIVFLTALAVTLMTIFGLLVTFFDLVWIWWALNVVLIVVAGISIHIKTRKRFIPIANILPGIKYALQNDMKAADRLIMPDIAADTRTFLISSFKEELTRFQQAENLRQSANIDPNNLLKGIGCVLDGNRRDAENIFQPELARQLSELFQEAIHARYDNRTPKNPTNTFNQAAIEALISDLSNLVEAITNSSSNASKANQIAFKAKDIAEENQDVVKGAIASMSAINKASETVGGIVKSINNIAFQTNLLALNASVEAARVGKAGAGFAVVAQEVRSLAQRATTAAQSTEESINEIIKRVVSAESQVSQTTDAFVDLVEKTGTIGQIIENIQKETSSQSHEVDRLHISLLQMVSKIKSETAVRDRGSSFQGQDSASLLLPQTYKIQTHWLPQAQFAGYYMAMEMDLYRKYGANVELIDGGPEANSMFELIKGNINFSTAWLTSALTTNARGAELRLLAQIFEISGLMLVCLKESGINKIEDLKHKSVSSWGGFLSYPIIALDMDRNLELHLLEDGVDIEKIVNREIDAVAVMSYNEIFSFYDYGLNPEKLTIFNLSDIGYNFPEDGLYTSLSTAEVSPEICQIVKQASIEGWQAVKQDPKAALDIVMSHHKRSTMQTDRRHQERMLEGVIKLTGRSRDISGFLDKQDFIRTADALVRIGLIKDRLAYDDFFLQSV